MEVELTTAVLGLGNLIFGDEGFGIHALRRLQQECGEAYPVEYIDGGVLGLNLLPVVESYSRLLVLDCINKGLPSGTVIEMDGEEIPLFTGLKLSEHQLGFQEVLSLAHVRGSFPRRLHLIGVQPVVLELGVDLSPAASAALEDVVKKARKTLDEWFQ